MIAIFPKITDNIKHLRTLILCTLNDAIPSPWSQLMKTDSFIFDLLCFSDLFLGLFICRRFGTKCAGCAQGISPNDLVRRARSKVFHLNCFTCMMCNKQLSTGEELYIIDENKFVCKEDYLSSTNGKDGNLLSGE